MEKVNLDVGIDRWFQWRKENNYIEEDKLQNDLRQRFLNCLKNTKVTQRSICKITNINEAVLSQWKHRRCIAGGSSELLDPFVAGALLLYLEDRGF